MDLITREVFMPMLCSESADESVTGTNPDKLMDLLHRLTAAIEVTKGYKEVTNLANILFLVWPKLN